MFRSSFLTEHVDMRVINTSPGVWEAAYIRKVLGLNNRGLRLIADYYNRKYQINTERCERSLMIGENNVDVIDHFVRYISTHWADKRALFWGGGGVFFLSDSESHPCPIIYEQFSRPDGSIDRCLYVSDSTGVGGSIRAFQKFLAMLGDAGSKFSHIRIMVSANAPRQASNGPCKSEAMTYLKNAMLKTRVRDRLRFPIGSDGSMAASVLEDLQKIKAVGAVPFLECPDMLKTAETRSSLAVAGIVPDEATLFTTKARKSFSEKMQEYEHALRWEKSASRPGVVVPDQRLFKCRGANMTKVAKHMAICFAHESREMMAGAAFVFTAIQASDFSTGLMILEDLVTNVLMPIYEMHRLVRVSISASKTLGSVQEQLVGYVLDLISRVSAQMKEMQSMDSNSDQKASLETCFESVKEIERDISGSVSVSVSVAEVEVAGESKVSGDVFVSSQVVQPVRVCMETEGPVPGGASSACL